MYAKVKIICKFREGKWACLKPRIFSREIKKDELLAALLAEQRNGSLDIMQEYQVTVTIYSCILSKRVYAKSSYG